MRMEQVEVSLSSEGMIVISQPSDKGEDRIYICKEQAQLLCKWIISAAKEGKNG